MSWTSSPLERARYLDGECTPGEEAQHAADLLADPAARARVEAHRRWIALFRSASEAPSATAPSDLLAPRVRAALAADRADGFPSTGAGDRSRNRRRFAAVAATIAAVALGVTWMSATGRVRSTVAADREVLLAAQAYRNAVVGVLPAQAAAGGSCEEGPSSPHRFPLVATGEVAVEACAEQDAGTNVAVVRRAGAGAGQSEKGLVIVPSDGRSSATDVGYTRVDDLVVFDVAIGQAKYFLATRWESVAGTPTCTACHGPLRSQQPERNPHRFIERAPVLLQRK